jgi:hypothetical protein
MRSLLSTLALLLSVASLTACQPNEQTRTADSSSASNANTGTAATSTPAARANSAPPIASSHGGGVATSAPPNAASNSTNEQTGVDTSALDAKIAKAEAKAKASGASEADKKAAAEAYFERGYFFYTAQNPKLYKFALRDFRRTLRYQPDNGEAREIIAQIEDIYKSLGRPIPTNGLEP